MSGSNSKAGEFELLRPRLRSVAYRMLGSRADADDAVQETWLRLNRSAEAAIENRAAWLTTVISHVGLDMLRARKVRAEEAPAPDTPLPRETPGPGNHPEEDLALADSVSVALLVVLDRLSPAERVAFVLHDMFDLNFEEIAPIVDRTPAAARQLASRARRRVRASEEEQEQAPENDRARQRRLVDAFLAAARQGDLQGLLAALDPNIVFRSDAAAVRLGGAPELRGPQAVAATFKGRAQAAQTALIDGSIGVIVAPKGKVFLLLRLTFSGDRITEIQAVADRAAVEAAEVGTL